MYPCFQWSLCEVLRTWTSTYEFGRNHNWTHDSTSLNFQHATEKFDIYIFSRRKLRLREGAPATRTSVDGKAGIQNWLQSPVLFYYISKICLFTVSAWFLLGSVHICQLMESGPFHHQILIELHFKTFTEYLLLGGHFESNMTQNMDQLLIYLKCDGKTDIKQAIILQEVQQCCCSGIHTNVGTSYSASNFCNFTWMAKDYKKRI